MDKGYVYDELVFAYPQAENHQAQVAFGRHLKVGVTSYMRFKKLSHIHTLK